MWVENEPGSLEMADCLVGASCRLLVDKRSRPPDAEAQMTPSIVSMSD
jgi:hypothetical protein